MAQFKESYKGKSEMKAHKEDKQKLDFYVEDLEGHGLRVVMAYSVREALAKLNSFGLQYGHKADINCIRVVPGDEVINIGLKWS